MYIYIWFRTQSGLGWFFKPFWEPVIWHNWLIICLFQEYKEIQEVLSGISTHTIRSQIVCWSRILSWKFHSVHAFWRELDFRFWNQPDQTRLTSQSEFYFRMFLKDLSSGLIPMTSYWNPPRVRSLNKRSNSTWSLLW